MAISYYHPCSEASEGYVFTGVCHSVNSLGGGSAFWDAFCIFRQIPQWRIQDFPQGVRQLPNVLLFFKYLLKTAWKWKNLDPQGGGAHVPGAPLDPPVSPPPIHI